MPIYLGDPTLWLYIPKTKIGHPKTEEWYELTGNAETNSTIACKDRPGAFVNCNRNVAILEPAQTTVETVDDIQSCIT